MAQNVGNALHVECDIQAQNMEIAMNNEPVAWMSNGKEFYVQKNYCPDFIPLYTHPAKTLTDEEILKMAADKFHYSEYRLVIEFARAILKKASEK
jgi:hypothetical protein